MVPFIISIASCSLLVYKNRIDAFENVDIVPCYHGKFTSHSTTFSEDSLGFSMQIIMQFVKLSISSFPVYVPFPFFLYLTCYNFQQNVEILWQSSDQTALGWLRALVWELRSHESHTVRPEINKQNLVECYTKGPLLSLTFSPWFSDTDIY